MNKIFIKLLEDNNLLPPPKHFSTDFYDWLDTVKEELDISFISRIPMPNSEYNKLKLIPVSIPDELDFYYRNSTPWDYDITEYYEHIDRIKKEVEVCLIKNNVSLENIEKNMLQIEKTLPIEVYPTAHSALAFIDQLNRLAVVSGSVNKGFKLGRPLSIGLRNYFVMRVINQLLWYESDGEKTFVEAGIASNVFKVGGWPETDPPTHALLNYFKFTNNG